LDVNEDEARVLLLSIDPLAALAETQAEIHERLLELTPMDAGELEAAWKASRQAGERALESAAAGVTMGEEQFLVLIKCRDEREQVAWLERLEAERVECK